MRRRWISWSCLGLVAWTAVAALAVAGDLPPNLVQKYEPAVEKLQSVYTHGTVTGTVRREYPVKQESFVQTYVLRAAGEKSRLDIKTTNSKRGGPAVGTVEVYMATPEASFYGIGLVEAPAIDTANELTYGEAKARIAAAFPVDKAFALGSNGTVLEVLNRPQVRVDAVKKVAYKGQQFVKITYDQPAGGKESEPSKSYVVLSPSQGWAVREFSKASGHGSDAKVVRGKISYGDARDGVPIIEKIETWQYEGREETCMFHEVVQVSRFDPGDPEGKYFTADGFH